jgi:HSP20 family protein
LFRHFLRPFGDLEGESEGVRVPSVDVSETENEVLVKAELPGISKENLDIEVLPSELILKAELSKEHEEGGHEKTYHLHERVWSRFERAIPLPAEVKTEEAKAKLHEGVLEITLPKREPTKLAEPRRIPIE